MSPRTPSPASADRILRAAEKIFHEQGIQAVSMDAVAADAGFTKMTLYQYFDSKHALLADVLRTRHGRRQESIHAALMSCAPDENPLLVVFDWLEEWLADGGWHGCAFVNATVETGRQWPDIRDIASQSKMGLRATLLGIAEEAGYDNASDIADGVLLLVEGASALSSLTKNAAPVRQARNAAEVLLTGYQSRIKGKSAVRSARQARRRPAAKGTRRG